MSILLSQNKRRLLFRTLILILSLAALAEPQGKGYFDGVRGVDKTANVTNSPNYRDDYEMLASWTVLEPKAT